jgi:hypothetical protein
LQSNDVPDQYSVLKGKMKSNTLTAYFQNENTPYQIERVAERLFAIALAGNL